MKPTRSNAFSSCWRSLLALVLAMATLAQAAPISVEDDTGRTVTLAHTPQRIVSLLPSLTETVRAGRLRASGGCGPLFQLACQRGALAGRGGGLDPNIEAIVALRPDVVLMATSSRAQARLESLGLKVVALEPRRTPTCSACWARWARCWACRMRSGSGA